MTFEVIHGDCLTLMAEMEAGSVDAVVTDPPYGLAFMGKHWDHGIPGVDFWTEALRVLKPSHYLLAFGGTRTWHRLACAIEDAGFEIRDTLMWMYSTGFPKSLDVAWAIHKEACVTCGRMVEYDHGDEQAKRGVPQAEHDLRFVRATYLSTPVYACAKCGQVLQPFLSEQELPALRAAWRKSETVWPEQPSVEGWGHLEADARKLPRCPLCQMSTGVLADGAQGWLRDGASAGSGTIPWQVPEPDGSRPSYRPQSREQLAQQPEALRIERLAQTSRGCGTALKPAYEPVILARKPPDGTVARSAIKHGLGALGIEECRVGVRDESKMYVQPRPTTDAGGASWSKGEHVPFHYGDSGGRWPANLVLDEEAAAMLDSTVGTLKSGKAPATGFIRNSDKTRNAYGDFKGNRDEPTVLIGDSGGPSRFFYNAKSSSRERNAGVSGLFVTLELEVCPCGESTAQVTSLVRAISEWATGQASQGCSTSSCGSPSSGQYLTVTVSTTSTETSKTTVSKTSPVWTTRPISESIADVLATLPACGISLAESAESLSRSLTTTNERAGSVPGARIVVSETPLRTSASVRLQGNTHPTCKPVALMRWLVRLVARPGDTVLDPFTGSGTTGVACVEEGRDFIGIERESEYVEIARRRIEAAAAQQRLPVGRNFVGVELNPEYARMAERRMAPFAAQEVMPV